MTLGMKRRPGQIPVYGFPVLKNSQIEQADSAALYEPGMIIVVKNGDNWSLASYVELDNSGCSQGEALVTNFATLGSFRVSKSATTDRGTPLRGIAAATIASQKFGWMYFQGYVEKADISETVASGEFLMIGGSVAGKLTPNAASVFQSGTQGNASAFVVGAQANCAYATGVGSIQLMGCGGSRQAIGGGGGLITPAPLGGKDYAGQVSDEGRIRPEPRGGCRELRLRHMDFRRQQESEVQLLRHPG